jgi:hypothetical protein
VEDASRDYQWFDRRDHSLRKEMEENKEGKKKAAKALEDLKAEWRKASDAEAKARIAHDVLLTAHPPEPGEVSSAPEADREPLGDLVQEVANLDPAFGKMAPEVLHKLLQHLHEKVKPKATPITLDLRNDVYAREVQDDLDDDLDLYSGWWYGGDEISDGLPAVDEACATAAPPQDTVQQPAAETTSVPAASPAATEEETKKMEQEDGASWGG